MGHAEIRISGLLNESLTLRPQRLFLPYLKMSLHFLIASKNRYLVPIQIGQHHEELS